MKRRSARPFTVEFKNTRTSRASLTHATERTRSGADLWRTPFGVTLPNRRAEVSVTSSPVIEEQQPPGPERRVLPCLVPIFALPVEADASVETRTTKEPRVRRTKAKVHQPVASTARNGTSSFVSAAVPVATKNELAVANVVPEVQLPAKSEGPLRSPSRATTGLRAGERWKRRLPRLLW